MNDREDTFIFKPEEPKKEEKVVEKIARTEVDEFTIARKAREYEEEEEKSSALPIVAAVLGVLLVIAIVAAVIFINSGGEEVAPKEPAQDEVTAPVGDDSDDEEEEEEIIIKEYTVAYNGGKIYEMENGGGYSIVFDVFDSKNNIVGNEKLYVNEDTVIKDENKKIRLESFITFIENQGGDIILFDCEVRDNDSMILTINYSSSGYGEEEETIEEEAIEGEEITSEESINEVTPPETNNDSQTPESENVADVPTEETVAESE